MATYNILMANTGAGTQLKMDAGDNLFLASGGTLNSSGADGASSTGGDNDLQINGTLAGGVSAFAGAAGDDLIQIYAGAEVLGGNASAFTIGGKGDNTFINDSSVSTHSTNAGVLVVELDGKENTFTNHADGSITSAQDGTGVYLNGGSNTFTNAGSIAAGTDGASFASGDAVKISGGGNESTHQEITNSGSMTALNGDALYVGDGSNDINNSGVMHGSATGVDVGDGDNSFTNAKGGAITGGSDYGVYIGDGDNNVHNAGSITGGGATGLYMDDGDNTIYNASGAHIVGENTLSEKKFSADGIFFRNGTDTLYNNGSIVGASSGVAFEGGGNRLTNEIHGHITGQGQFEGGVYAEGDDNTISNKGHITGGLEGRGVSLGGDDNTIHNYSGGVIQDSVGTSEGKAAAVEVGGSDNLLTNSGTIIMHLGPDVDEFDNAAIRMFGQGNTITNTHSGVISDGASGDTENDAIFLGNGGNVVNNAGHITGTVVLGFGSTGDSFNGATGTFNGTIEGGSGNDAIEVGKGTSTVYGGDGADFLQAGSGVNSFDYTDVGNSYGSGSTHFDTVDGFNTGKDSFNFALNDDASFDAADFKIIAGAALTDSNFDADITADIGSSLKANSAVLLSISGGEYAGDHFLIVDGNGHAGYQAGEDYVVELTNISGTMTGDDVHSLSVR